MAEIVLDAENRRVSAVMTEQEFAAVSATLSTPEGKQGIASMFASFIQQSYQQQAEREKTTIKRFADTATDQQRAAMMAVINQRGER